MVEMHIDNYLEFEKYLNMTSAFNDEIYNMKYEDEWMKSCEFDIGNRRLLQLESKDRFLQSENRKLID